jgi:hypothetical protein
MTVLLPRMWQSTLRVPALLLTFRIVYLVSKIARLPAPRATLVTPLHRLRAPSVDDICATALAIPVYTAEGDGFTTCIRVYEER